MKAPENRYRAIAVITILVSVIGLIILPASAAPGVSGLPSAWFSGSPTHGSAPLTVMFKDVSTVVTGTMWNWSFGDATWFNATSSSNPTHIYLRPGTYTVSLTVTNATGSNTDTRTNYITVNPAGTGLPVAWFSGTPLSGAAPLTVMFKDAPTVIAGTMWNWSFGDTTWFNATSSSNPTHIYPRTGTYTVSLTITNASGSNTDTRANYINVTNTSPGNPDSRTNRITNATGRNIGTRANHVTGISSSHHGAAINGEVVARLQAVLTSLNRQGVDVSLAQTDIASGNVNAATQELMDYHKNNPGLSLDGPRPPGFTLTGEAVARLQAILTSLNRQGVDVSRAQTDIASGNVNAAAQWIAEYQKEHPVRMGNRAAMPGSNITRWQTGNSFPQQHPGVANLSRTRPQP